MAVVKAHVEDSAQLSLGGIMLSLVTQSKTVKGLEIELCNQLTAIYFIGIIYCLFALTFTFTFYLH